MVFLPKYDKIKIEEEKFIHKNRPLVQEIVRAFKTYRVPEDVKTSEIPKDVPLHQLRGIADEKEFILPSAKVSQDNSIEGINPEITFGPGEATISSFSVQVEETRWVTNFNTNTIGSCPAP